MPGTTGNITWKQLDPKTIELANTDRTPGTPTDPPLPNPGDQYPSPPQPPEQVDPLLAQRMLQESLHADPSTPLGKSTTLQSGQRREYRKQARLFDKYLRSKDRTQEGTAQGVQEMLDSGAIWFSDKSMDTFGASKLGQKQVDRMMQATDAYRDFMDDNYGKGWEKTGKPLEPWQKDIVDRYEQQQAADPVVQQRTADIKATMGY